MAQHDSNTTNQQTKITNITSWRTAKQTSEGGELDQYWIVTWNLTSITYCPPGLISAQPWQVIRVISARQAARYKLSYWEAIRCHWLRRVELGRATQAEGESGPSIWWAAGWIRAGAWSGQEALGDLRSLEERYESAVFLIPGGCPPFLGSLLSLFIFAHCLLASPTLGATCSPRAYDCSMPPSYSHTPRLDLLSIIIMWYAPPHQRHLSSSKSRKSPGWHKRNETF